jgi:arginine decarboxylase
VEYNPKKLVRNVEAWVTNSMKKGIITPEEGRQFLNTYRAGLYGYTYLERD